LLAGPCSSISAKSHPLFRRSVAARSEPGQPALDHRGARPILAPATARPPATMESAAFDFLAACRPGMVLRTRDRRAARILAVAPETGEIRGEVQMMGACVWRADGRYRDAPA